MATFTITAVHLEHAPGATHDHIGRVKLLGHTQDYSRAQIIRGITGGDLYFTNANPPAQVYVHPCPFCFAADYITTHRDSTATNNLLHLQHY